MIQETLVETMQALQRAIRQLALLHLQLYGERLQFDEPEKERKPAHTAVRAKPKLKPTRNKGMPKSWLTHTQHGTPKNKLADRVREALYQELCKSPGSAKELAPRIGKLLPGPFKGLKTKSGNPRWRDTLRSMLVNYAKVGKLARDGKDYRLP